MPPFVSYLCATVVAGAALVGACTHQTAPHDDVAASCRSAPPSTALPFTADRVTMLVGEFRVTMVDRTRNGFNHTWDTLSLRRADSVEHTAHLVRRIGFEVRRDLQLVDAYGPEPDIGPYKAEFDAGVLYLGCRDCLDAW